MIEIPVTQATLVKSDAEIAPIARAAAVADWAIAAITEQDDVGITTRDAAAIAVAVFLAEGADIGKVGPIVKASGPTSSCTGLFAMMCCRTATSCMSS